MNLITDPITSVATDLAKTLAQKLVDGLGKEAHYLCCYGSYVENFEEERRIFSATRDELQSQIDDARRRNRTRIKPEVDKWLEEADGLITEDIETKKKCFSNWCPDCIWQYKQGKALEKKTIQIGKLKERYESFVNGVLARPAELPSGCKIRNFVEIKSRESEFKTLEEALKDEGCFMVGLHGMGGTGKTTMAKLVANKVEESKVFDKVIFVVVSTHPNFKKMRDEIGKHLLEEGMEADSETLLKRIVNYEGKLLIVLDDVWEKFDLTENVGIPSLYDKKNFTLLITTRHSNVCEAMGCKTRIHLQTLNDEEALNLFLIYAGKNRDSSSEFKHVAKEIVGQCGGLPVAIVALASALKNRPIGDWKASSTTLQKAEQLQDVPEDMKKVYESLILSYDKLNKEEAKELLLLCSLFPADTEIPMEDLIRCGIGLGLFGEVDKYYALRRHKVIEAKNDLLDSSLLMEGEEENCVKMHDLVREVALWIEKKGIQAVVKSETTLKGKLQYLLWESDTRDFPDEFDVTNLKILLLLIDRKDGLVKLPNEFFAKMKNLKVLLFSGSTSQSLPPSFLKSLHSLEDIRTLMLADCALGDISVMGNLLKLETLELEECSISELPKEIKQLKTLRLLGLRRCQIERNNPFEVIEACPELEELYFVENRHHDDWWPGDEAKNDDAAIENRCPPKLQRYYVSLENFDEIDGPRSRCFNPTGMKDLISEVTFNHLVKGAEILQLGKIEGTGWTNVIPDVVPINNEEMDNLVNLSLNSLANIKCLVDTNPNPNLTVFSKLVWLSLYNVDVEELYSGVMPRSFLMELDFLSLKACKNLHNVLFKGDYNLCHLKIMRLRDCPRLKSIFQASSAQSLEQLEELKIEGCSELECIIEGGDVQKSGRAQLFPKLETLEVERCDKLVLILPFLFAGDLPLLKAMRIENCEDLKYVFGEYRDEKQVMNQNGREESMLPSLEAIELNKIVNLISIFREGYKSKPLSSQMPLSSASGDGFMEKHPKPTTSAFSWPNLCCFLPTTISANDVVSKVTLPDHRISQELHPSRKWVQTYTAQYLIQPLNLKYLKKVTFDGFPKLKWVFTLSIATSILVEELKIIDCCGLENIIQKEEEHEIEHQMNCCSIFPKLKKLYVYNCRNLVTVFSSPFSVRLEKLKTLCVSDAPSLVCVFWEYYTFHNHAGELPSNDELHNHLPALDVFCLDSVPKMISVCSHQAAEELFASVNQIQTFLFSKQSLNLTNIKKLSLAGLSSFKSLFTPCIATSMMMEELTIYDCDGLEHIVTMLGEDHHHHHPNCIFPKLEELCVYKCSNLEIMFPSTFSVVLEKLQRVSIESCPQLKYIFGKYDTDTEDYISSNGNKNNNIDELHINLPVLELLYLKDVPDIMGFYGSKNQLHICPSFFDLMVCSHTGQLCLETTKESLESNKGTLPLNAAQCPLRQPLNLNLHNIKKLFFYNCSNIIMLFTLPIASRMKMLETLEFKQCCNLVYIVADERNAQDHMKYDSFFPNLKRLRVLECQSLKFLFPAQYSFRYLKHLKGLSIKNAPELNYVFGTSYHEYSLSLYNQNVQTQVFDLPALQSLRLEGVPNLFSICPNNYSLSTLSLEEVILEGKPLFTDSTIVKSADDERKSEEFAAEIPTPRLEMQALPTSLTELESTRPSINESLESNKGTLPLSAAQCPLRQPLNLDLHNIKELYFENCSVIVTLFTLPIASSMKMLETLVIKQCCNLLYIVADEGNAQDHVKYDLFFPNLKMLKISECQSLKFLFPAQYSFRSLKHLETLRIENARALNYVFGTSSHESNSSNQNQNVQTHVLDLPALQSLELDGVPNLFSICPNNYSLLSLSLDKSLFTDSTNMKSTDHEGTSNKFAAEIPTPTLEMQASLNNTDEEEMSNELESTRPSINLITKPTSELNSTNQKQELAEMEKDIRFSHETNLVLRSTRETTEQEGHQEHYATEKVMLANIDLDSWKQYIGPLISTLDKESAQTVSETKTSVEEGPDTSLDLAKDQIMHADHISSPHHQSQIGVIGSSTAKNNVQPILGIGEIFQLMEMKDGEEPLLAKALEQYPQLRLSRHQRTNRIISLSYRVLVDVLVVLATKTPSTITAMDKQDLEANLDDATILGFDKDWIETIRAKVLQNNDMSDVHEVEKEILDAEAKIEECVLALERVHKQRAEIDDKLMSLLEDHKKLVIKMRELREIERSKDKPFGF